MAADFKPELGAYKSLKPFVFWAQATLPTVFDDSLSYYETVSKLAKMINTLLENTDTAEQNIEALAHVFDELQDYVNHYFDNLDVQNEINNKLDALVEDGTLDSLIEPFLPEVVASQIDDVVAEQIGDVVGEQIGDAVEEKLPSQFELGGAGSESVANWLAEHITTPSTVVIDDSLTIDGAAADAGATGRAIENISVQSDRVLAQTFDVPIYTTGTTNTVLDPDTGEVSSIDPETVTVLTGTCKFEVFGGGTVLFYGMYFLDLSFTGYAFFDEDDDYISGEYYSDEEHENIVNVPADAYYCVASFKIPQPDTARGLQFITSFPDQNLQNIIEYLNNIKLDIPAPVLVDSTLSVAGEAADAKVTGDRLTALENVSNITLYPKNTYFNGSRSNSTGAVSGSSSLITTAVFYLNSFASLHVDSPIIARVHLYGDGAKYLGGGWQISNDITHDQLVDFINTSHPQTEDVVYVAFTFGGSSNPVRISTMDNFHIEIRQYKDIVKSNAYLNIVNETIDGNRTYYLQLDNENKNKNLIVEFESSYTGEQPTVQFTRNWAAYNDAIVNYRSALYSIGTADKISRNVFRFPAWISDASQSVTMAITVTTGSSLYIKNLSVYYDNLIPDCSGPIFEAHSSSGNNAPSNTIAQFELAAKCGYKYCIAVPKVTRDGEFVCLHDDANIQATARNDDGTTIAVEYQDRPVRDFNYSELLQFDFGIYKGKVFAGQRIPKLSEFFAICARTGMHPVLSVHPNLDGFWPSIKALADHYNLTDKLTIKAPVSMITYPASVFGDSIESYAIIKSDNTSVSNCISSMQSLKTTYNITKAACGIELTYAELTDAIIETILGSNMFVGVNTIGSTDPTNTHKILMSKGVTRFTEDYIASVGLDW